MSKDERGEGPCQNTDREIWREGDFYSSSIHVTEQGLIGINVGGRVIVRSVSEWYALSSYRDKISESQIKWEGVYKVQDELKATIRELVEALEKIRRMEIATWSVMLVAQEALDKFANAGRG